MASPDTVQQCECVTRGREEDMPKITGQLFFREIGKGSDLGSVSSPGKKIVMVLGVISVNAEIPLESEAQYTIMGNSHNQHLLALSLSLDSKIDVSDVSIGNSPSGILRAPIWRV
jgi:hypothetical protein